MHQPFAVIFDMDGVIIDSNPHHKIALRQFCEKYGYQLDDAGLTNKVYGRQNKEWIANLFQRDLSPAELYQFGEEKELMFREIYKKDIVPLKGLPEFLEKLDLHHIARAIGTSAPKSNVDFVLKETGLARFFEIILNEADVTRGKPDPEIYLKVISRLNLPGSQCIVFEDSLSGILSARAAGARVVGVATTHTHEELGNTDFVINDFQGLDPVALADHIFRA